MTLIHTSLLVSVRMEVEPNKVLHTSPVILADVEKIFKMRYPIARDPTESIAMAASPLIFVFCPPLNNKIATTTVIGITRTVSFAKFKMVATAIAPNATWDNPSPI